MMAIAKINGRHYMVDDDGAVLASSGLGTKYVKVHLKSPIARKLLKRLVKTMNDKSERYSFEITSLRDQVTKISDKLDSKMTELRNLKFDIEDKGKK
jgi:hypothetical protein